MKTLLPIILCLVFGFRTSAQMQINRSIELTGNGTDAKVTGIQSVSTSKDAASVDYIQKDSLKFAAATGANNAYEVSLTPVISSLSTGMVVLFKANFSNTGAATLNVNGLNAKPIKKNYDVDLDTNDIKQGQMVSVMYDGTNFQMLSQIANVPVVQAPSQPQAPTAGTLILINADEQTASANSYNAGIKSYNLAPNTYSRIIIEAEGTMAISVNGGSTCSTTASITVDGNSIRATSFSRGVSDYDTWSVPFAIKGSLVQQNGGTIRVEGSFSMSGAGSGTISVNSLRVYGVY